MKNFLFFILMFVSVTLNAEDFSDFTAELNSDWKLTSNAASPYPVAYKRDGNLMTNILVTTEAYTGDLESYSKASIKTLKSVIPGWQLYSKSGYTTRNKVKTVRLKTGFEQSGYQIRQTQYLFQDQGSSKYFVVTCTSMKQWGTKYDSACSKYIDTFKFK